MRGPARRTRSNLPALTGTLALAALGYALFGGRMRVDLLGLFGGESQEVSFFMTLRLPRLLTGILVGAGLATSGVLVQGVLRNELVEPGILGLHSGAELGILATLLWYSGPEWGSLLLLPMAAWAGGILAVFLVALLSAGNGGARGAGPLQLLLTGLAVTLCLSTINTVLALVLRPAEHSVAVSWQAGSLGGAGWGQVALLAAVLSVLMPLSFAVGPSLDVLQLGDRTARGLGMAVGRTRAAILALAVGLCGACIAVGGGLAFVGLLAPHVARSLGGTEARPLLVSAALVGAAGVLAADALARTLFLPSVMPTGIVLAILGVPYFLYLLSKT